MRRLMISFPENPVKIQLVVTLQLEVLSPISRLLGE